MESDGVPHELNLRLWYTVTLEEQLGGVCSVDLKSILSGMTFGKA